MIGLPSLSREREEVCVREVLVDPSSSSVMVSSIAPALCCLAVAGIDATTTAALVVDSWWLVVASSERCRSLECSDNPLRHSRHEET